MSAAPATSFNPSEALEAQILDAVLSQNHSLASIAELANTTVTALSLWLNKPAIRGQLAILESTAAWRIRLTATFHLDAAVGALTKLLKSPALNALAFSPTNNPSTSDSASTRHSELGTQHCPPHSLRASESIRRSASTLIRLARFKPIGPTEAIPTEPRAPGNSEPAALPNATPSPSTASTRQAPDRLHIPTESLAAFLDARSARAPIDTPLRSHKHTPGRTAAPNSAATLLQSAGSARAP